MELNETYFYTVAIVDWIPLLEPDKFKLIVLNSLIYLVEKKCLVVYGFVIMPNHIHLIWECTALNGKEMPHASFMKFTAHAFLKELRQTNNPLLIRFKVNQDTRNYQFWQNDAKSTLLYNRKILEQKLDYTHYNPVREKWNLVADPSDYYFSSCSFYERNDKKFDWLTHYADVF